MRALLLCSYLCLFAATNVGAQAPGIDLTFTPKIGFFTPLTNLSETAGVESKLASGLALGLAAELDFPLTPISIRANVDLAVNSKVETDGTASNTSVDQLNLVGDLVFRPLPRIMIVQPYLLAGAGIKRYSLADEQFEDLSETFTDFTGHAGGGVVLNFGPLQFSAEVSDYISSYESSPTEKKLQHDIFAMLGLRISLL